MKDGLGEESIDRMARSLKKVYPAFPEKDFRKMALDGLNPLELKDRTKHLIAVLHRVMPDNFEKTADLFVQMKPHWDPGDPDDNLRSFAAWPIIDYIAAYGLGHPEVSLKTLKEITALFSAEFAIRPFIIHHFDLTFQTLERWTADPDEQVRRLVSEGTRPRLPWGCRLPQFIENPAPVFQLLEKLKDDPSETVRRSVANNLNDISKDHPEQVIQTCRRWKRGAGKNREWIIRHAARSLVKNGHPEIFGLLGHTENPALDIQSLEVSPAAIQLGEAVTFRFTLTSRSARPQSVVIDYAIHHVKANGRTAPKVFKFRTLEIGAHQTVELSRQHRIKPVTTRTYYPGRHAVEILINGKTYGQVPFTLSLT
ncbi:DNA alkylation repair protein [Pontiella sp.]|uniref:DNA alkylation repair protein n=1 Tax=Pontiella sp. TaxID=2837462 RepID=UPI003565FF7E